MADGGCSPGRLDCDLEVVTGCEVVSSACPNVLVYGSWALEPSAIAVVPGKLFFTVARRGDLFVTHLDGGGTTLVGSNGSTQFDGVGVAAVNDFVYWTGTATARVRPDGTDLSILGPAQGGVRIVSSTRGVLVAERNANVVRLYTSDGGMNVAANVPVPLSLTVSTDGTEYVGTHQGLLARIEPDAGATSLKLLGGDLTDLEAADGYIYFASYAGNFVGRTRPDSSQVEYFDGANFVFGVAVDSDYAYWANFSGGELWRKPVDGGVSQRILSGRSGPWDIAVDSSNIYWSERGSSPAILAMPKR